MENYKDAFRELASLFRNMDGWEARQETPPSAYLHISKPGWLDQNLNGIHLETYVMAGQLQRGHAPVCLHCERGFPKQREFMKLFTERARIIIEKWPGYRVLGPEGCSVCEIWVPLGSSAEETTEALANEIFRLQELTPLIDQTIVDVMSS